MTVSVLSAGFLSKYDFTAFAAFREMNERTRARTGTKPSRTGCGAIERS